MCGKTGFAAIGSEPFVKEAVQSLHANYLRYVRS